MGAFKARLLPAYTDLVPFCTSYAPGTGISVGKPADCLSDQYPGQLSGHFRYLLSSALRFWSGWYAAASGRLCPRTVLRSMAGSSCDLCAQNSEMGGYFKCHTAFHAGSDLCLPFPKSPCISDLSVSISILTTDDRWKCRHGCFPRCPQK